MLHPPLPPSALRNTWMAPNRKLKKMIRLFDDNVINQELIHVFKRKSFVISQILEMFNVHKIITMHTTNQQYSMLTTARTVNTSYLITLAQARLYGVEYIFFRFFIF